MSFSSMLNSRCQVWRRVSSQEGGMPTYDYQIVSGLEFVPLRLDLQYVTPKDIAPPVAAGKAPDRYGRAAFELGTGILPGDRLEMVTNEYGETPVEGTFEIRSFFETAQGFSRAHHLEVQVWETQQQLDDLWPSDEVIE